MPATSVQLSDANHKWIEEKGKGQWGMRSRLINNAVDAYRRDSNASESGMPTRTIEQFSNRRLLQVAISRLYTKGQTEKEHAIIANLMHAAMHTVDTVEGLEDES